jgi:hypothetical protein
MLRAWIDKRDKARFEKAFTEWSTSGGLTSANARRLSDYHLHSALFQNKAPVAQSILQSELKRREAWRGPAKWSMIIAVLALIISVAAYFKP